MLQRGRVSRANRLTFSVDVEQTRLEPLRWLSRDEKKLFAEIVGACRPKHFTASDEPLIISYCQATLLARRSIKKAGKDRDALLTWEGATKLQGMLATKLRIAPQSRIDQRAAGRVPSMLVGRSRPWEEA